MNDDLRFGDTIAPKSDQLNADDLFSGPRTFEIIGVRRGSKDQPVEVLLKDSRPYRPCKSMRRIMIRAWGDQGKEWIGNSLTLYCDPTVKYGGVAVGGIRISHLSGIGEEMKALITESRSRRKMFHVKPISESTAKANTAYPAADFEMNFPRWLDAIESGKATAQQIIERCQSRGTLSEAQIEKLRAMK